MIIEYPTHTAEVERAKLFLQMAYEITEQEAYSTLVVLSQNHNITKQEVAEAICKLANDANSQPRLKQEIETAVLKGKERVLRRNNKLGFQKDLVDCLQEVTDKNKKLEEELTSLKEVLQNFLKSVEASKLEGEDAQIAVEQLANALQRRLTLDRS